MLRVDEGDIAATGAKDELRLVLEQDLDDLVCVSQEDRFLGPLPLLDVDELATLLQHLLTLRSRLLRKAVRKWLELLIAVQVALEVLQEHYFLVDRLWVVEEIEG